MYHERCFAFAVCILILLSIFSNLPSNVLPRWQNVIADTKFTDSTGGPEETQSISGPTIQDFSVNTTQCSAPVQWNYSLTDSYGLTNATFWWNNGTTDMGNTTYTFSSSPLSGNALFNFTLPSFAENVTFQFWAYNAFNWTTTDVRWMLVYPYNSSEPYFLNLGTAISTIQNANSWTATSDSNMLYAGMVLQQNTTAQLQTMIDNFITTRDYLDVLRWSAICNKLGITQYNDIQNDLCYALGNYTMVGSLPFTQDDLSRTATFCVEQEWALYGYYYANTTWFKAYSGYNANQWNIVTAFQQFNSSVYYSVSHGSSGLPLWVYADGTGETFSNRYYDEDANTIECYILFSQLLNVSGAMDQALHWWSYLVNTHWTGSYFAYTPTWQIYECEAPFFLEIISLLKYYNVNLANWTNVITDIGNRFLSSEWTSAQWSYNVVVHGANSYGSYANNQLRLQNTLGAWQVFLGTYLQLNNTYENNMKDMLLGNVNTQQAWQLLLQNSVSNIGLYGLFNSSADMFSWSSGVNGYTFANDPVATAYGEILMWMMGMVPGNTTIAFPLEELSYEYIQEIDPQMFQFNLTNQTVTIPVTDAGTMMFQYGTSPVTCNFNQSGIWQLVFSNSWNLITNMTYVSALPTNRIYFMQTSTPPPTTYDVTVNAYSVTEGKDVNVDITVDGSPTGYTTPYTFTDLNGTHTFEVPDYDTNGHPFILWSTGQANTTITVSSAGTYVAYYEQSLLHDIAVTQIELSKTAVGRGMSLNVNVTAANLGEYAEAFDLSLFANTIEIGNTTVTNLPNETSTLIFFVWNTTGYAYGNYTISATTAPVPGETDIGNSTFTGDTVSVTILGDINGDFKVSLADFVLLANAYGSRPGQAKWNPNADINGDGVVDLLDLVLLASHYGQTV